MVLLYTIGKVLICSNTSDKSVIYMSNFTCENTSIQLYKAAQEFTKHTDTP
jgi:hypothetical protein